MKFTVKIWGVDRDDRSKDPKVTIDTNNFFLFLDMKLFWRRKIQHTDSLKPNQQLKYLNSDSNHIPSCFQSNSRGVLKRLSKLTTMAEENQMSSLDELYPHYFHALKITSLTPSKILILKEQLENNKTDEIKKMTKNKDKK